MRLKPVAKKTTSVAKTTPVAKKAPVAKRRPVAKKAPRAKPVYTKGMSLSEKIDAWQKAKFE